MNLPENESCKDAGLSLTFDETRQIALDQEHITILTSHDDNHTTPNEDDRSSRSLQNLLYQPMREESWTKLRQDCLNKGHLAISDIQNMVHSSKEEMYLAGR